MRILISSGVDLMMKAASTSETLVNVYETTRSNISEDSHLNIHRRENLKYHTSNWASISLPFILQIYELHATGSTIYLLTCFSSVNLSESLVLTDTMVLTIVLF
jgi:hypothetical protein